MRSFILRLLVQLALLAALVACSGGQPPPPPAPPDDDLQISGTVSLPSGSPLDLATLKVSTPIDLVPIATDGSFEAEAFEAGTGLISLADGAGRAVLLGFADTTKATNELSARSTAMALLYVALGAHGSLGIDGAQIAAYLDALPELPDLSSGIEEVLASDPLAIADGSDDLLSLVREARDTIIAREKASAAASLTAGPDHPGSASGAGATLASLSLAVGGNTGVLILDPGAQGGFELIAGAEPFSISVRNDLRRDGQLFLYQIGIGGSDGSWYYEYPDPIPQGGPRPVLPALGIKAAIGIAGALGLGGDSALSPSTTQPIVLDKTSGDERVYYRAVVVGATTDQTVSGPLILDERYGGFIAGWGNAHSELVWRTYWTQILYPLFNLLLTGQTADKVPAYQVLADRAAEARQLSQPFAQTLGLTNPLVDPATLVTDTLIAAIRPPTDQSLFDGLMAITLGDVALAKLTAEKIQKMKGNAETVTAKAFLALIGEAYAAVELDAVVNAVRNNPSLMSWDAARLTQSMEIYPPSGELKSLVKVSELFTVTFDRAFIDYQFIFRWSTSGEYGYIDQPGRTSVDTKSADMQYLANDPVHITEELYDTIQVEIYLDDGSGQISDATPLMGVATSEVKGVERQTRYRGGYEIVSQQYESGGNPRYCMQMFWVFDRKPDAKSYEVRAFNYYDHVTGSTGASLGTHMEEGLAQVPGLDPTPGNCGVSAEWPIAVVGNEVWIPWSGGHGPEPGNPAEIQVRFFGAIVDVTATY